MKNCGEAPLQGFDNDIIKATADRLYNSTDGGCIADSIFLDSIC